MNIVQDDLSCTAVQEILMDHVRNMREISPPGSSHALNLDGLRIPSVTVWSAWNEENLAGVGAIEELSSKHGEIKSMRTAPAFVRQGVARQLLQHIVNEAKRRGYERISLETGSYDFFSPARKLYESFGFEYCGPFAEYVEDPNSVFMTLKLS